MKSVVLASIITIALVCVVLALALWAASSGPTGTSASHYPCDPPPGPVLHEVVPPDPFLFANGTHAVASDLCVAFAGGAVNNVLIVVKAPGCPDPPLPALVAAGNLVFIDWGVPCVDPGEMVQVTVRSEGLPVPVEVIWTLNGDPITPTPTMPSEETPTLSPTLVEETPSPTPTPTPEPGQLALWGDPDCDNDSDAVDALKTLQHVAAIGFTQTEPCPDLGASVAVTAGAQQRLWGDVDCDGDVDAVDALKLLRNVAALSVDQEPGCPAIGSEVTVEE